MPGDKNHLERLLTGWSKSEEITVARLRHIVGISVIAQMLDGLRDDQRIPRIAFKGGSALVMRFGTKARATKDLDAAFRGNLELAVSLITEKAEIGWCGFTGRVTEPQPIETLIGSTTAIRFKIKLAYRNKDFMTIPFEMSTEEAASLNEPEVIALAISLKRVQLIEPAAIAFLPIRF
ncbi:nucleotidyl transferase AbiEii/AbiGii toxin family protein [Acidithrix ferrooxidans]|uniref:Nucleotidyl transferase AbiEii toxin, Type IV TA system n=1 Tax=Acidithrix ferrooxidans TaxID=1280514 RepID=A0A0D8HL07_9ACTN|nr:nucleotidyl transferase AbiEii/AbiGii toxin family protein [Acidithrix ferrooxidans]KJF18534.1 hypothetical protein AXFE_05810 [Acidithrix ferrooxidans]